MRFLFVFLVLINSALAANSTCELIDGFYRNSPNNLRELKFTTVVDVFSLNNAKTLTFNLDGDDFKFLYRVDFRTSKHTNMVFRTTASGPGRAAHVLIDRKPRKAFKSHEFLGNIVITPEMENPDNLMLMIQRQDVLTYNFRCSF